MDRDALTLEERALIGYYVRRYRASSPYLDAEELYCEGRLGLLSARRTWNPSRHCPFRNYAAFEVRNAIAAAIRRASPTPKDSLEHARQQRRACLLLERHGHPATDANIASVMGLTMEAYHERQRCVAPISAVAIGDVPETSVPDALPAPDVTAALARLSRRHPHLARVVQDSVIRQLNYRTLTQRYRANPRQITAWKRQGLDLLRRYLDDANTESETNRPTRPKRAPSP